VDSAIAIKLLRDMIPGAPVPLVRCLAYTVAAILLTAVVRPGVFAVGGESSLESYSILSMDLAMSRAFCGTPSAVSPLVSVSTLVSTQPELGNVPAKQLAAERSGTLQRFCETSIEPRINNENSLMWLDSWLWRLRPNLSIHGIGQWLHGIRVAGLAVAFACMVGSGSGVLVAATSWAYSLALLQELRLYAHHSYPFLLVLLVLTASVYAVVSQRGWTRSLSGAGIIAALCGAWSAFGTNMRSSHLPIYVAFAIALFLIGELRDAKAPRPARLRRLGTAAALFAAGFIGFQYGAITRHLPANVDGFARHTVFHPLVLGLGVPESELSRREGIYWSDSVGLTLARKIDPNVGYLDRSYERALQTYYSRLWSEHPSEMRQVYADKGRTAGKHMFSIIRVRPGRDGTLIGMVLGPIDQLPNGLYLTAFYVLIAIGGLWRAGRGSVLGALLAFTAAAAVLLQVEATIIMSNYVINYQSYLAMFSVFISLLLPGALVGMLWDRLQPRVANG
jgi:hypothetical protein